MSLLYPAAHALTLDNLFQVTTQRVHASGRFVTKQALHESETLTVCQAKYLTQYLVFTLENRARQRSAQSIKRIASVENSIGLSISQFVPKNSILGTVEKIICSTTGGS